MKVILDEEARSDLDRIYAWIAKDNSAAADSVIERILVVAEYLARFPNLGHPGKARGTFEWVVKGLPYIIVYELPDARAELIITGIFHGAQENRHL
ncbi:MAG TPA: type II toxin-antitoxin system RelE/ParE family toxin [Candidatus Paceibacterota bacterium]